MFISPISIGEFRPLRTFLSHHIRKKLAYLASVCKSELKQQASLKPDERQTR